MSEPRFAGRGKPVEKSAPRFAGRGRPVEQGQPKAPPPKRGFNAFMEQAVIRAPRIASDVRDVLREALVVGGLEGGANIVGLATDRFRPGDKKKRKQFFNNLSEQLVTRPNPTAREIGSTILPSAVVSKGANLLVPLATKIPVAGQTAANIFKAVERGGFGKGLPPGTPFLEKARNLGVNIVGGGTAAGLTAALSDQDVASNAAFGAAIPVLGSFLKRAVGFVGDLTQMSRLEAAKIIRETLGENVDRARKVLEKMPANERRLVEQAMLDAGIQDDAFYGLGKIAESQLQKGVNPMRVKLEQQAAAREALLAEASGGLTEEAARATRREARKAVTKAMTPLREEALDRANIANIEVPRAQQIAQQAIETADDMTASGLVPDMRKLETRYEGVRDFMTDRPDIFPDKKPIGQVNVIAGKARQRADEAIDVQLKLRDTASNMDAIINDLAAQGLRPTPAAPLIQALQRQVNDPVIAVDDLKRDALTDIIQKIRLITDSNGMVNMRALGELRRVGLNNIINKVSSSLGGDPSRTGIPEGLEITVLGVRDLIDDTIRAGGAGDMWSEYLNRSAAGYRAVNRMELAGEAQKLYKAGVGGEQKAFLDLVGGESPRTVGKIMGGGPINESFEQAFAGDPQRLAAIRQTQREIQQLNRLNELRGSGVPVATEILTRNRPNRMIKALTAASLAQSPGARIGAGGFEQAVNLAMASGMRPHIGRAYDDPAVMADMLNRFAYKDRISEQVSKAPPILRNIFAQGLLSQQSLSPPSEEPYVYNDMYYNRR